MKKIELNKEFLKTLALTIVNEDWKNLPIEMNIGKCLCGKLFIKKRKTKQHCNDGCRRRNQRKNNDIWRSITKMADHI